MTGLGRATAIIIGAVSVACLGGVGASATPAAEVDATHAAERKGEQARAAYRAGHYERAIALYFEANDIAASAGFLFNVAFIYDRKLGDADLALQYYRRVATFPGAEAAVIAKARARIAAIEGRQAGEVLGAGSTASGGGAAAGPARGAGGGAGAASVSGGGASGARGDATVSASDARPQARSGGVAPWVLVGTGGALVATGAVFAGLAAGTEGDYQGATDPARRRALQEQGRGEALTADLLMAGGAVVAGAGLLWWALADGDDEGGGGGEPGRQSLHLAPAVLDGGLGVAIGGRL